MGMQYLATKQGSYSLGESLNIHFSWIQIIAPNKIQSSTPQLAKVIATLLLFWWVLNKPKGLHSFPKLPTKYSNLHCKKLNFTGASGISVFFFFSLTLKSFPSTPAKMLVSSVRGAGQESHSRAYFHRRPNVLWYNFLLFIIFSKYFFESDKVVFDVRQEDNLSEPSFTWKLVWFKAPTELFRVNKHIFKAISWK